MGKMAIGYGSEFHLLRLLGRHRKELNKAEYFGYATQPYEIMARAFAQFFIKQNPKFNHNLFVRKCATDYKGDVIHIHTGTTTAKRLIL